MSSRLHHHQEKNVLCTSCVNHSILDDQKLRCGRVARPIYILTRVWETVSLYAMCENLVLLYSIVCKEVWAHLCDSGVKDVYFIQLLDKCLAPDMSHNCKMDRKGITCGIMDSLLSHTYTQLFNTYTMPL